MNTDAWKNVDYNSFAKTFSNSRKNMKWEEISYFLEFQKNFWKKILDVWCGNWRLLGEFKKSLDINILEDWYLWIDLSSWLLEQARELHPWYNFKELNMLDLNQLNPPSLLRRGLGGGLSSIFFIASFHHLNNISDRLKVLKDTYRLLESWWYVYMTNWALDSDFNYEKYKSSIIEGSENDFWSKWYNIKIWKSHRFYHCFSLEELEYLSKEIWFEIVENRLFENKRNYILILKKA